MIENEIERGDLVRVKDFHEAIKGRFCVNVDDNSFTNDMLRFTGLQVRVKSTGTTSVRFYPTKESIRRGMDNFHWTKGMFEIVEKGFPTQMKYEKVVKAMIISSEEIEKLKSEMISKVDKKKIKRILSATMQLPATKLLGLDKLLEEWAESKYKLYRLLNNELKVTVQKNVDIDEHDVDMFIQELTKEFPRRNVFNQKFKT